MVSGKHIAYQKRCKETYINLPDNPKPPFEEFELLFRQQSRKESLKKAKKKYGRGPGARELQNKGRRKAYSIKAAAALKTSLNFLSQPSQNRTKIQNTKNNMAIIELKPVLEAHVKRAGGQKVTIPKASTRMNNRNLVKATLVHQYTQKTQNIHNKYFCAKCINALCLVASQYFDLKAKKKQVCEICGSDKAFKLLTVGQVVKKFAPQFSKKSIQKFEKCQQPKETLKQRWNATSLNDFNHIGLMIYKLSQNNPIVKSLQALDGNMLKMTPLVDSKNDR